MKRKKCLFVSLLDDYNIAHKKTFTIISDYCFWQKFNNRLKSIRLLYFVGTVKN